MKRTWDGPDLEMERICLPVQGDSSSIPWLGRSVEGGHGNPLQYSCLGKLIPWTEDTGRLQSVGSQKSRTWLGTAFTKAPSWFLSSLGNYNRTVAWWERLSSGVWSIEGLSGPCSEISAHLMPSKAIVSLICPGSGGGSRKFGDRWGQKLPVTGQWWVCENIFSLDEGRESHSVS